MEVRGRKGVARLLAACAAIAFILPYLALKIAWVSGVPVGMANENLVAEPGMLGINVLTFGMAVVAVLLALTFAHGWGQHVRAERSSRGTEDPSGPFRFLECPRSRRGLPRLSGRAGPKSTRCHRARQAQPRSHRPPSRVGPAASARPHVARLARELIPRYRISSGICSRRHRDRHVPRDIPRARPTARAAATGPRHGTLGSTPPPGGCAPPVH